MERQHALQAFVALIDSIAIDEGMAAALRRPVLASRAVVGYGRLPLLEGPDGQPRYLRSSR